MPLDGVPYRNAVKFAKILGNTERYTAPQMQAYQRRLLERLVRHAKAEVPFYETRLDPLFGPNDEIRWDRWEEIPIFTRAEAQEAGDALYAMNTPSQAGDYVVKTTSGSTGMPMSIRASAITGIMSAALNQRIFDWHNLDTDASIAFVFDLPKKMQYPHGYTSGDWNLRNQKALAHQLSISCTVSEQIEWLCRKSPSILSTFPQNARAIVADMLADNIPIPFEVVVVHGEVLDRETQQVMQAAGIKIIDRYGGEDIGPISASCPVGTGHHQFAEVGLTEFMDKPINSSDSINRSTLITTPFYNYAMPMIRYQNGDLVETINEPCRCGRTLPRIKRILGRDRNMFTFGDGTKIWPDITRAEYEPFLSAKQFQVIQHTPRDIEFIYVPDDKSHPVDTSGFSKLLKKHLHNDINVQLTEVEKIKRAPSGKFETWKSLVEPSQILTLTDQ